MLQKCVDKQRLCSTRMMNEPYRDSKYCEIMIRHDGNDSEGISQNWICSWRKSSKMTSRKSHFLLGCTWDALIANVAWERWEAVKAHNESQYTSLSWTIHISISVCTDMAPQMSHFSAGADVYGSQSLNIMRLRCKQQKENKDNSTKAWVIRISTPATQIEKKSKI